MEAYHAAELLRPRMVSSAHTRGLPSSPSSPSPSPSLSTQQASKGSFSDCQLHGFTSSSTHRTYSLRASSYCQASSSSSSPSSTQQATSKLLPIRAFPDCQICGFSSSSTHHVNRKHLPRAFSDCQVQTYSSSFSSSPAQQAIRKHLPQRVISDCLVQGSSSSPTQRFKGRHFPRAFSDCQAQKSSSSSSIQHVNMKRLPRAFSDFQVQGFPTSPSTHLPRAFMTQRFSFLSSTQHANRMHLPRAFSNHRTHLGFELAEHQPPHTLSVRTMASLGRLSGAIHGSNSRKGQPRKHTLSVRTTASLGRLSGAIHGSNSRKGRPRKRPHQGNSQELENSYGNEIVSDMDSHMFCDDVPYDKDYVYCDEVPYDTDGHMFCDDVPYNKDYNYIYCEDASRINENNHTGTLLSRTYMYDSIHGDFWQNDPYYQEFERLENEIARQEPVLDGSTTDRSNEMNMISEKNLVKVLDVGSSQNNECLMAVHGNGAAIAYKSMDISESSCVFPATATEGSPSPFKDSYKSVKEPFSFNSLKESAAQDFVGTLERDQHFCLDPEKCLSQQDERGKDMVREVGSGERPSANLGSLQNVEGTYLESRQCYSNDEVDGTGIECRSFTEAAYVESRQCSSNDEEDGTDLECRSFTEAAVNGVVGSVGDLNTSNAGASVNSAKITEESGDLVTEVVALANAHTLPVGEQVSQGAELVSDSIKEQVENVMEKLPAQVSQVAEQVMLKVVDQVAEVLPDPVVEQVGQVAEQVTQTAEQFVEQVANQVVEPINAAAFQIVNLFSSDEDDEESDDEFEAYTSLDIPEFKGHQGLSNFTILQERGIISVIYDFYIFMLKRSPFEFMLGMFAAPILLSVVFTILYIPEFNGLAFDETVREFLQSDASAKEGLSGLQLSWETIFQVFMFSVSLSTGLQPELAPLSPYTLVVANLNALVAQLIFVFLSGAVFARLSQPSQPVKFSTVAIICPLPSNRRLRKEACHKALLTRYVLVGPQPCELVDVKVDLTYNYNTVTRSGTYFRTTQSLKLVRPEIAFLNKGMLVRHIIDETSPLYHRTPGMLEKEDAVFSLSVVGLERSSMQSVFHVQHYCVYDKDVVWDAEFVDMILISKKNQRVVDHSLLSKWKPVAPW